MSFQARQEQIHIEGGGLHFSEEGSEACLLGKFLNIDPRKHNSLQFEQLFSVHFAEAMFIFYIKIKSLIITND